MDTSILVTTPISDFTPVGLFFVASACRDKILFGGAPHPRSITSDDRSLARELTRALLSYLTTSSGETSS